MTKTALAAFETSTILTFMFTYAMHANPESTLIADIPRNTFWFVFTVILTWYKCHFIILEL
jgi:hypothetical protein|tara:strand:+ start:1489 stop:1671 length:183 start_codon:yes stop_codon:yes gene_type:complete